MTSLKDLGVDELRTLIRTNLNAAYDPICKLQVILRELGTPKRQRGYAGTIYQWESGKHKLRALFDNYSQELKIEADGQLVVHTVDSVAPYFITGPWLDRMLTFYEPALQLQSEKQAAEERGKRELLLDRIILRKE